MVLFSFRKSFSGGDGKDAKFKVLASRWDVGKDPIGEGGFGSVHLATHRNTGKERALKAMRLKAPEEWQDFHNEILIMKRIKRHHNICHILDTATDKKYGYIVMQACSGGELFDRITQKGLTEKEAALAVVDVLSAVRFLHQKRIVHRDLKPENLLYKDQDPGAPLKVIDFGIAVIMKPGSLMDECCGTTSYMAPEVLTGPYDVQCDLWAVGVIVFCMLSGSLPFMGKSDMEKKSNILRGNYSFQGRAWRAVSDEAKDFVSKLLVQNPKERRSAKEALEHPWIVKRAQLSTEPLGDEITRSLKSYCNNSRFERAVRHKMATQLTSGELQRLRNMFEELDTNDSGEIPISELRKVLETQGGDLGHLEALVASIDYDGDGTIDWKEFVAACIEEHTLYNEDNLEKVFNSLDVDKSGGLCQKEIAELLGNDAQLSKELLQKLQATRKSAASLETQPMSLDEFCSLLRHDEAATGGAESRPKTKKRMPRAKGSHSSGLRLNDLEGEAALAEGLKGNSTLQSLNLGHNSLDNQAKQAVNTN